MGTLQHTLAQRLGWAARMRGGQMTGALSKNRTMLFTLVLAMAFFVSADAMAGAATSGGGEDAFGEVYTTLKDWIQGTLGRIIALTLVLVGAVMGVVRQSLITFVVGVAMGLALYNAPMILDTVMGASIEGVAIQAEGVIHKLTNGMQ